MAGEVLINSSKFQSTGMDNPDQPQHLEASNNSTPTPIQSQHFNPNSTQFLLLNFDSFIVPINGFAFPVFIFIAFITNLLVCIVLLKKHMRNNCTNIILIAMAISDTMTGLWPLPCFINFYTLGRYMEYVPYSWCFIYFCLTDHLPTVFHTASVWLTVALAGQRYLYVCHPTRAKAMCTIRNVIRLIISIYGFAALSQLWRFTEFKYTSVELPSYVQQMHRAATQLLMTSLSQSASPSTEYSKNLILSTPYTMTSALNHDVIKAQIDDVMNSHDVINEHGADDYEDIVIVSACRYEVSPVIRPHEDLFYNVYFWFRVVFVHFIPCLSLVLLNASLIRTMRTARTRRQALTMRPGGQNSASGTCSHAPYRLNGMGSNIRRRSTDESSASVTSTACLYCAQRRSEGGSTTLMLVTVVGVFLLVEIPLAVLIVLNVIENTIKRSILPASISHGVHILFNFLTLVSYPLNFFIYCGMSRQFRRTFMSLFSFTFSPTGSATDPYTDPTSGIDRRTAAYRRAQRYMPMPLEPRR